MMWKDLLKKNRDTVSDGHLEVLKASTNETLINILEGLEKAAKKLEEARKLELEQAGSKKPGPIRTVNRKPTLGSMFKQSLIELMNTINSTNVHYIRCIKPNADKEAWQFDNLMVLSQLRACGVLETIRISCAGFPSRWTFEEFVLRYYILIPHEQWDLIFKKKETTEEDIISVVKMILDATVKDKSKYQIGNTKIFFKAGMLAYLEKLRSNKMHNSIVMIQKKIRAKYYRKQYLQISQAIKYLQNNIKGFIIRQRVNDEMKVNCATLLQAAYRGHSIRANVFSVLRTITNLQKKIRKELNQRQLKQEHEYNAVVTIQSKVRTFEPRSRFLRTKKDTVVVQSLIRRRAAQRKLKQLKADAKSVNHLKEVSYKLENKVIELTQNLASKVKENKEMTERIKELQVQVEESAKLQATLENMKKRALNRY